MSSLESSGVANPVTAVLLNFRSYDTFLEIAVLWLAIAGVWAIRSTELPEVPRPPNLVLHGLLRSLLPLLIVASGYLLWVGAFAPGGAFQGGALAGAVIVLAAMGGYLSRATCPVPSVIRAVLLLGVAIFGVVGVVVMSGGGAFLQYPEGKAKGWILLIESAALISIGATLGALYVGGQPVMGRPMEEERDR